MKVLVTGGTGFLGGRLVRLLCSEGYDVRASGLPGDNTRVLSGLRCEFRPFDLLDRNGAAEAMLGVEAVFHVAAMVAVRPGIYEQQMRVNVEGTRVILAAAIKAGVKRFVHTSTVNTLGIPPAGQVGDEETPFNWQPFRMGYMDSKHSSEQAVLEAADRGLDAVCVLPGTLFGPGDINFSAGTYIREAARWGLPVAPPGGTTAAHVDDVARGHLLALEHGRTGQRYVLGGELLSYRTLYTMICEALGKTPPLAVLPEWALKFAGRAADRLRDVSGLDIPFSHGLAVAGSAKLFYSSARAESELGYRSRPVRQAIEEAVAWYRRQGLIR